MSSLSLNRQKVELMLLIGLGLANTLARIMTNAYGTAGILALSIIYEIYLLWLLLDFQNRSSTTLKIGSISCFVFAGLVLLFTVVEIPLLLWFPPIVLLLIAFIAIFIDVGNYLRTKSKESLPQTQT